MDIGCTDGQLLKARIWPASTHVSEGKWNLRHFSSQNSSQNFSIELPPSAANTLDRRDGHGHGGGGGHACDTCDAPMTPASIAGLDHHYLEQRPLTRSVTRATIFDEPPEK